VTKKKILLKISVVFLVISYGLTLSKVEQLHQYSSKAEIPISPSVDKSFRKTITLTGHDHRKDDHHPFDYRTSQMPVLVVSESVMKKEKLQIKLDRIYQQTGRPYEGGTLWELSDYVPVWMKEYFDWHRIERQKLTADNWKAYYHYKPMRNKNHRGGRGSSSGSTVKLMVMQCIMDQDAKCGGTADRLKSFVYLIREAYEMKRLLLIHWTMPARIEEFLVPPVGGIDWTAPEWLHPMVRFLKSRYEHLQRFYLSSL
jgi:hypothetical protein